MAKSVFKDNPLPWRVGKEELGGHQVVDKNGEIVGRFEDKGLAEIVCNQMNMAGEMLGLPAPTVEEQVQQVATTNLSGTEDAGLTKEKALAQQQAMMRQRMEESA